MPLIPNSNNTTYCLKSLPNGVFRAGNRYLSSVLCGTTTTFCGIYNTPQEASDANKNKCCKNKYNKIITYSGI